MNTYETVVRSVCAALTAALLLALSPSVALATVVPSGAPTITMGYPGSAPATLQVGQTVTCNTSSVTFTDSANTAATFQTSVNWYHQDLPTTSIGAMPSYTAVTGDIGFHLVCAVTGTEVGVANATDESALSAPSPVVAPVSTLTLTQYSPQVSGNLGQASSGMNVTLTLSRGTYAYPVPMETPVATGSATTDGAGSWTATLKSTVGPADEAAFGLLGDQLLVHYYSGSGTPPPDVTYSLNGPGFASVQFLGDSSTISPDGGRSLSPTGEQDWRARARPSR